MSLTATQTSLAPDSGLSLRKILLIDAAMCLGMGLLLMAASGALSTLLGLPKSFIFWAGAALLPCAALMVLASRLGASRNPPALMTWLVILGNAAWVVASVLSITLWFSPTLLGALFVSAQAIVVTVLAVFEYRAR
jgi:hypothetical protein